MALIPGRSRVNAQQALDAAARAGVDPALVRATKDGYEVPDEVFAAWEDRDADLVYVSDGEPIDLGENAPAEPPTPDEGWKNADIEAWARDQGLDLGGATKKADMLAAIAAAGS